MSATTRFLRRRCGSWTSQRRYLFFPKMEPVNLVTNFEFEELDINAFQVTWKGQTSGEMLLSFDADQMLLRRSRDYFSPNTANSSEVEVIDADCIVMRTSYDGLAFREEVRLFSEDLFAHRYTVGVDIETKVPKIIGSYWESRI